MTHRDRNRLVAGLVAVLLLSLRAPLAAAAPLGVGPLRLGMTLEEVKAALPAAEWRDTLVSPFSGRVFGAYGDQGVEIEGLTFHVQALSHYYQFELGLYAAVATRDAAECERTALDWLARVESQAGPFTGQLPSVDPGQPGRMQWHVQRGAGGSVSLVPGLSPGTPSRTDGESVKFGSASTALVQAFDRQYRPRARSGLLVGSAPFMTLSTSNRRGNQEHAEVLVEFAAHDGARAGEAPDPARPNCAIQVQLERAVAPAFPAPFVVAEHPPRFPLTLAQRHLAYPPDAGALEAPVDVEFQCDVSRQSGWVQNCGLLQPENLAPPLEYAALTMVRALQFDMSGVDRDDPQSLRGPVRVRLEPGDRLPLDFLQAPRLPVADVIWVEQPEAQALLAPVLAELSLPPASEERVDVTVACRILADGSLLCAGVGQEPAHLQARARRVAGTEYRAAAKLRDGRPSAGQVIDLPVRVSLDP